MSLLSIALISMDKLSVDPLSVDKRTLFRRISLSKITHTSSARPILLTRALSRVFSAMVFSAKALATLATFSLLMSASADDAAIKNVEIKSLGNNNYQISVTLLHADTGWDHYANRWDVLDEDGNVLGTRVLAHPHVNEQPFTRSGGRVNIGPEDVVYVRAHMNNLGYGTDVYRGTEANGFAADTLAPDHAEHLATEEPLPAGCAF